MTVVEFHSKKVTNNRFSHIRNFRFKNLIGRLERDHSQIAFAIILEFLTPTEKFAFLYFKVCKCPQILTTYLPTQNCKSNLWNTVSIIFLTASSHFNHFLQTKFIYFKSFTMKFTTFIMLIIRFIKRIDTYLKILKLENVRKSHLFLIHGPYNFELQNILSGFGFCSLSKE